MMRALRATNEIPWSTSQSAWAAVARLEVISLLGEIRHFLDAHHGGNFHLAGGNRDQPGTEGG